MGICNSWKELREVAISNCLCFTETAQKAPVFQLIITHIFWGDFRDGDDRLVSIVELTHKLCHANHLLKRFEKDVGNDKVFQAGKCQRL